MKRRIRMPDKRTVEVSYTVFDVWSGCGLDREVVVTCEVTVSREEWGRCYGVEVLAVETDDVERKPLPVDLVTWGQIADAAIEAACDDERCEADEAEAADDDAYDRARDDELTERYGGLR